MPSTPNRSIPIAVLVARLERAAVEADVTQLQRVILATFLVPESFADLPAPARPTTLAPGSAEKIEIMRLRVNRNERPHHTDDSREGLLTSDRRRRGRPEGTAVARQHDKYRARPRIGGRRIDLGLFPTREQAERAVRDARRAALAD